MNTPKAKIVSRMQTPAEKLVEAEKDHVWPGGEQARWRGCICPYSENHPENVREVNGNRMFTVAEECPVHGRDNWK